MVDVGGAKTRAKEIERGIVGKSEFATLAVNFKTLLKRPTPHIVGVEENYLLF